MSHLRGNLGLGVVLVAIWLLLWGEASLSNLLSGLVVAAIVTVVLPDEDGRPPWPTVRPLWALRFLSRIAVDLIRANVVVSREIASPGSSIKTGVVAVPMAYCSDGLLTVVANVLSLTPGTMPVEVTTAPPVIYIHVLHLHDVETVRRDTQHLAALAVRAFGSSEAVAALEGAGHRAAEGTTTGGTAT